MFMDKLCRTDTLNQAHLGFFSSFVNMDLSPNLHLCCRQGHEQVFYIRGSKILSSIHLACTMRSYLNASRFIILLPENELCLLIF